MIDTDTRHPLVDEPCRHCGKSSRDGHPAGVIAGRWRCVTGCGEWQGEPDQLTEQIEEGSQP